MGLTRGAMNPLAATNGNAYHYPSPGYLMLGLAPGSRDSITLPLLLCCLRKKTCLTLVPNIIRPASCNNSKFLRLSYLDAVPMLNPHFVQVKSLQVFSFYFTFSGILTDKRCTVRNF